MYYINLIKEVLKCDDKVAQDVLDNMGEYHLSSMSKAQLTKAIKETHTTIKMTSGKSLEEIQKMMYQLLQGSK